MEISAGLWALNRILPFSYVMKVERQCWDLILAINILLVLHLHPAQEWCGHYISFSLAELNLPSRAHLMKWYGRQACHINIGLWIHTGWNWWPRANMIKYTWKCTEMLKCHIDSKIYLDVWEKRYVIGSDMESRTMWAPQSGRAFDKSYPEGLFFFRPDFEACLGVG